jgi:hypothetical protein
MGDLSQNHNRVLWGAFSGQQQTAARERAYVA